MKLRDLDCYIAENDLLPGVEERSGIYCICLNEVPVYVGQSKNVRYRLSQHIYFIENAIFNQEHKYLLLYSAKIGCMDLSFKVIEYCNQEDLNEREDYWILYLKPSLNIITPNGKQDISQLTIAELSQEVIERRQNYFKERALEQLKNEYAETANID